jgi:hypothetical protein
MPRTGLRTRAIDRNHGTLRSSPVGLTDFIITNFGIVAHLGGRGEVHEAGARAMRSIRGRNGA